MNDTPAYRPGATLQAVDFALKAALVLLIPVTVFAIGVLAFNLLGRGDVRVTAELNASYRLEFEDGRAVGVMGNSVRAYENFPEGVERAVLGGGELTVSGLIQIDRNDRDARLTFVAITAAYLIALWVGLLSMIGIVAAAMRGEPFDAGNPRLLRRVGWAIVSVPVVNFAGGWLLQQTIDIDLPFDPTLRGPAPPWLLLVIGLAVFALAQAFAEASRLREFEQATI